MLSQSLFSEMTTLFSFQPQNGIFFFFLSWQTYCEKRAPDDDFLHSIVCFVLFFFYIIFYSYLLFCQINQRIQSPVFSASQWNTLGHLTFPVHDGEVGVGGTYSEDELVSDEGLVRVDGAYRLNQLWRGEQKYGVGVRGGEGKGKLNAPHFSKVRQAHHCLSLLWISFFPS